MPFIGSDAGDLWVEHRGEGPEVLLLAGLGIRWRLGSCSSTASPTATS